MLRNLIIILVISFDAVLAVAQTQKYDIVTYKIPAGWEQKNDKDFRGFAKIDKKTNSKSFMLVYSSVLAGNLVASNHIELRKTIAEEPFTGSFTLEPDTTAKGDVTLVSSAGKGKANETEVNLLFITFTKGKKVLSFLAVMTDQTFVGEIENFINTFNFDAKRTAKPSGKAKRKSR